MPRPFAGEELMAQVFPFKALRYAPDRVPIEKVVTQPYDKISREMQDKYYSLHAQNLVRIVLGKPEPGDGEDRNVYTRAADYLNKWRHEGVLVPLGKATFVVYFQKFLIPGTRDERIRKGFIGLGQLEDYANRVIFPHEKTLSGPKQDRLQLLRHTRTHFEQIFVLYEDPAQRIDKVLEEVSMDVPDVDVTDEYGVSHFLWIVERDDLNDLLVREMADKKLIIADGHHRYETALAYRDEMRARHGANPDASWERMPMAFFNMYSPGLTILPTHRVLSGLRGFDSAAMLDRAREFFDVTVAPGDSEDFRRALSLAGASRITIGVCADGGNNFLLGLRDPVGDQLDVVVLHSLIVEKCLGINEEAVRKESNITYVREFDAALQAVREGRAQVSLLLNPTKLEQMRDIAYSGRTMPQKSTDFYPKVLSGLMMYAL